MMLFLMKLVWCFSFDRLVFYVDLDLLSVMNFILSFFFSSETAANMFWSIFFLMLLN